MGNKQTLPSFPTEAVVTETVRTLNTFGPLYLKAYALAAAAKARADHDVGRKGEEAVEAREGFRLLKPPTATEPLERGWLTKLGAIKKNWKRRYFVACEEADNFCIYYFEVRAR